MDIDTVLSRGPETVYSCFQIPELPGFVLKISDVFSAAECSAVIAIAETTGFVRASFFTDKDGTEHYSEIRKSDRCILDSKPFAAELFRRLYSHLPAEINGCKVVGVNERLRVLKYSPGDEFKLHSDGCYISPIDGSYSVLTILLYLNEGYEGGFTTFLDTNSAYVELLPHVGMVSLQDQPLLHLVPPLKKGVKYVLRTEVMYAAPSCKEAEVKVVKV